MFYYVNHTYFIFNSQRMPAHWEWLLGERIRHSPYPQEAWVNCAKCPVKLNHYTHPARCCTYRPQIGNFLTGLALQSGDLPTAKFKDLLQKGVYLPLATLQTPHQFNRDAMRSDPLVCHYWKQEVGCTIHKFRNGICSTFFCFTEGGDGIWTLLADYVSALENNLSWWVLEQLGFNLEDFLLTIQKIDTTAGNKISWDATDLDILWGHYRGKEHRFFIEAAEIIQSVKSQLYFVALDFLEKNPTFQTVVSKHPDDIGNTHLPFSKNAILQLEQSILDQVGGMKRSIMSVHLSLEARFEASTLPMWKEYYSKAYRILILKNSAGDDIDFQPLSSDEYKQVMEAAKHVVAPSLFLAGLIKRGFFVEGN